MPINSSQLSEFNYTTNNKRLEVSASQGSLNEACSGGQKKGIKKYGTIGGIVRQIFTLGFGVKTIKSGDQVYRVNRSSYNKWKQRTSYSPPTGPTVPHTVAGAKARSKPVNLAIHYDSLSKTFTVHDSSENPSDSHVTMKLLEVIIAAQKEGITADGPVGRQINKQIEEYNRGKAKKKQFPLLPSAPASLTTTFTTSSTDNATGAPATFAPRGAPEGTVANVILPGFGVTSAYHVTGPDIVAHAQEGGVHGIKNGYSWKDAYTQLTLKDTSAYSRQDRADMQRFAGQAQNAIIASTGVLSDFQRVPFAVKCPLLQEASRVQSAEHLLHALKFPPGHPGRTAVLAASTPGDALRAAGRAFGPLARANPALGPGWGRVSQKVGVYTMLCKALESKTGLQELLEASGDDFIIEDTSSRHHEPGYPNGKGPEKRWGDNGDGTGCNKLGLAQMQARELIRQAKPFNQAAVDAYFRDVLQPDLSAYYNRFPT